MTTKTAIEDADPNSRSECWCCGMVQPPDGMVHLGNHPEVAICVRCAHFVRSQAWEIEDQAKTGYTVRARNGFRRVRREVIRRQLHQNRWIGAPLRWLGRRLP